MLVPSVALFIGFTSILGKGPNDFGRSKKDSFALPFALPFIFYTGNGSSHFAPQWCSDRDYSSLLPSTF